MGFYDSLVPLVVFECEQVKFRPKKKVQIKVLHSVVAVRTVWGEGGGQFNLISELKFL